MDALTVAEERAKYDLRGKKQIAKFLGYHKCTLERWAKAGKNGFPVVRDATGVLVANSEELRAWYSAQVVRPGQVAGDLVAGLSSALSCPRRVNR